MSIWPGNAYFGYRYDYATEYVKVMKELWADGVSNFQGKHFTMKDCKMLPKPAHEIQIVAAGQSGRGMEFASEFADFNFIMGSGINTPNAIAPANEKLVEAAAKTGRDVGSYVLFMLIAEDTDEEAQKKWDFYREGQDVDALAWMADQV
jgi:pyrimidine oxygenase